MELRHAFSVDYNGIPNSIVTQVEIHISPDVVTSAPRKSVRVNAVWDTGATGSVISPEVVDLLGLPLVSKGIVFGVGSDDGKVRDQYMVDLVLPNNVKITDVFVSEVPIKTTALENAKMLIGMDIIRMGDMTISNGRGRTKFCFCIPPHDNPVCLVEKSIKVNKPIARQKKLRAFAIKTRHPTP